MHLVSFDALLSRDKVEQLVSLLSGALLLFVVFLDELGKLRGPFSHGSIILLFGVVGLSLTLEFRDDLVFLP